MPTALALEESPLVETMHGLIHRAIRQGRNSRHPSQPRYLDDCLRWLRQTMPAAREVVRR